jgi:hypothetical protein
LHAAKIHDGKVGWFSGFDAGAFLLDDVPDGLTINMVLSGIIDAGNIEEGNQIDKHTGDGFLNQVQGGVQMRLEELGHGVLAIMTSSTFVVCSDEQRQQLPILVEIDLGSIRGFELIHQIFNLINHIKKKIIKNQRHMKKRNEDMKI